MRPRFMNRGSDIVRRNIPGIAITSMRPRFMNRGSILASGSASFWLATSMRPRFMNRGSLRSVGPDAVDAPDFNEAPIHESGKS